VFQEVKATRTSRESAYDGGKVVSPKYPPSLRPPSPREIFLVLISVRG